MVKRAKYIVKTTRHGDVTHQDFTMIDPPDYPRATTCNLPFEQIKHLLSSRPFDLGEVDAVGHGRRRDRKHRGRRKGGSRKGFR